MWRAAGQRADHRVGDVAPVWVRPAGDQAGPGERRRCQQALVVAAQHRHSPRPAPADLHHDAAGPADDVAAADQAQVGPDQPGARPEADQACGAHPPRRGRLRVGQRQVAVDLGRAIGRLGPLAGQRRVRRAQLRHHRAGEEPQVRAQRPAGHPGQARGVRGEPLDHRRVQQHLGDRIQAQADREIRQPGRRPQQVLRPLPSPRRRPPDHRPGEPGRQRRDRGRLPRPDIPGDRARGLARGRGRLSRPGSTHAAYIQ
jgi:hypothetical protein